MTAVQTLREPKVKRLTDIAPQSQDESSEPETSLDRFRLWCRESVERQEREGPFCDEPPLTMEEIVAICKEARAEIYAEEQEIADYR